MGNKVVITQENREGNISFIPSPPQHTQMENISHLFPSLYNSTNGSQVLFIPSSHALTQQMENKFIFSELANKKLIFYIYLLIGKKFV